MKKESGLSLIDFIIGIADVIVNQNGKPESPYDVNFTNHYVTLHNFEENCGNMTKDFKINQIVQDKKTKTIDVESPVADSIYSDASLIILKIPFGIGCVKRIF